MFFGQDVLFKDGPLALMWMAGNEEFKSMGVKNRRNKHYLSILEANVAELAALIRKYFPEMGTVNGLSLKKTSVLVKGLSVIYLNQVQHLAWSMHDTHLRMQSTNVRMLKEIDLPAGASTRGKVPRGGDLPEAALGFGDLHETGDLILDGTGPRFFTSNADVPGFVHDHVHRSPVLSPNVEVEGVPKRKRKRRREEGFDENQVLQMLQDAVTGNPTAHCLTEADPIPDPPASDRFDQFGDMGMGFEDFTMPGHMQSDHRVTVENEHEAPEMISAEDRVLLSPENRATTRDLDRGEGRHAQQSRRRLAADFENQLEQEVEVERANNEQDMNGSPVDQLQLGTLHLLPRRGRRRRRQRLEVDAEPQIPLREILSQLQAQKRPLDYDECQLFMLEARKDSNVSKSKRQRNEHLNHVLLPLRKNFRGTAGNAMSIFVGQCHNIALQERRRIQNQGGSEDEGRREEITGNEVSDIRAEEEMPPGQASTFGPPPGSIASGSGINNAGGSAVGMPEMEQPMNEVEIKQDFQFQDRGMGEVDIPLVVEPPSVHEDGARGVGIEALGKDPVNFKQLFPPGRVSKKKAATAFFQLLRMQSLQKVSMEQEEPYGDIFVTRL